MAKTKYGQDLEYTIEATNHFLALQEMFEPVEKELISPLQLERELEVNSAARQAERKQAFLAQTEGGSLIQMNGNQFDLIARTVEGIFKGMEAIKIQLKSLTSAVAALSSTITNYQQTSTSLPNIQSSHNSQRVKETKLYTGTIPGAASKNKNVSINSI